MTVDEILEQYKRGYADLDETVSVVFRKCTCSALEGKPHYHIAQHSVISWDKFVAMLPQAQLTHDELQLDVDPKDVRHADKTLTGRSLDMPRMQPMPVSASTKRTWDGDDDDRR